ncbi:hypothetical protein BH10ACT9_BH10ACT9_48000 [soil metagenome]
MSTDADQVRARLDALLGELPEIDPHDAGRSDLDIDDVARRLEEAHDVLVQALESVEKG